MLRDAILLQKRERDQRLGEKYVEREAVLKEAGSNLIKVIIGPRRAGKSFFAMHAFNKIGDFGYVNFDDERLVEAENYDEIIEAVKSVYGETSLLLLDEIQNLPKWELLVNRLQRQGYNLVVTGSNANLLSQELATHLTGRHVATNVFPFSFREMLKLDDKELTGAETSEKLRQYLENGGYPEPYVKKLDGREYVSTLFDSIIFKDIVKRHKIRSPAGIEDLAIYLISNAGKEFSLNTLATVTKCKSAHTVEKYLKYLEETFLVFTLRKFSFKLREQISSNKKIYCADNGFINAKAFKNTPAYGTIYENAVAIELRKKEANNELKAYWWKNQQQYEVDFVVKEGAKITGLIQVCYDVTNAKTKEREVRALLSASKELNCKNLLVITRDYEAVEEAKWFGLTGKIEFKPLWKWLLHGERKNKTS